MVAHIYGRNIEPTFVDDIYRYDYEVYAPESEELRKGTVHHARSDGILKLIGAVLNETNGTDAGDLDDDIRLNIEQLLQYIFDQDERYDMANQIINGTLCKGLLTKEEMDAFTTSPSGEVLDKVCNDPNNDHIYAFAYRVWKGLGFDEDDERDD